jgi:integrase
VWMSARDLDPEYQSKLVSMLDDVVTYVGNPVIRRMRDEGERFPMALPKDVRSIDETTLEDIQSAAEGLDGWTGDVAMFLVAFYPATGLRPSELRRADLTDLNTRTCTFRVQHLKGEKRYARKREVLVLPQGREATLRFLKARHMYLGGHGMAEAVPLIPCVSGTQAKHYSSNWFRVIKAKVESIAGQEFKLKDFRPTFTQMCLDRDPNLLSDISKQLGHSTTRTTEKHYGCIGDPAAFRRWKWRSHRTERSIRTLALPKKPSQM